MKEICPVSECAACFACANICPKDAITFEENEYGILYPQINGALCIDCHACEKVCPSNNKRTFSKPLECYAAWRTDMQKRRRSASGGIANLFYEYVISEKSGSVWGVRTTDDFEAVFAEITDLATLEQTKGSKYTHSHARFAFRCVQKRLQEGKNVLFVGLPCQVAGLLNFLRKGYENLVTCDLICHGVLPGKYLKEEISFLKAQMGDAEVAACSFRDNAGSNFCLCLYDNKGSSCYKKRAYFSPYFSSFLQAIALRPNCYACKYARPERIADITLGDYIGLGKDAPFSEKSVNNSLVAINTERGRRFWNEVLKTTHEIKYFVRDYDKAVPFQPSLVKPFSPHRYTESFLQGYKKMGFAKAARKILFWDIQAHRLRRGVYICLHFYRIPKKLLQYLAQNVCHQ